MIDTVLGMELAVTLQPLAGKGAGVEEHDYLQFVAMGALEVQVKMYALDTAHLVSEDGTEVVNQRKNGSVEMVLQFRRPDGRDAEEEERKLRIAESYSRVHDYQKNHDFGQRVLQASSL
jgi:hypothetical protein